MNRTRRLTAAAVAASVVANITPTAAAQFSPAVTWLPDVVMGAPR